jgi:hypothetical protein
MDGKLVLILAVVEDEELIDLHFQLKCYIGTPITLHHIFSIATVVRQGQL